MEYRAQRDDMIRSCDSRIWFSFSLRRGDVPYAVSRLIRRQMTIGYCSIDKSICRHTLCTDRFLYMAPVSGTNEPGYPKESCHPNSPLQEFNLEDNALLHPSL